MFRAVPQRSHKGAGGGVGGGYRGGRAESEEMQARAMLTLGPDGAALVRAHSEAAAAPPPVRVRVARVW